MDTVLPRHSINFQAFHNDFFKDWEMSRIGEKGFELFDIHFISQVMIACNNNFVLMWQCPQEFIESFDFHFGILLAKIASMDEDIA